MGVIGNGDQSVGSSGMPIRSLGMGMDPESTIRNGNKL